MKPKVEFADQKTPEGKGRGRGKKGKVCAGAGDGIQCDIRFKAVPGLNEAMCCDTMIYYAGFFSVRVGLLVALPAPRVPRVFRAARVRASWQ